MAASIDSLIGQSLRITLLGGFGITRAGRSESPGPGSERVIGRLGIDRGIRRDALRAMLWPDAPDDRAAANLRSALWRIRRRHPGLLDVGGGAVALDRSVEVDALELAREAHTLVTGSDGVGHERAVEVVLAGGGELLPGWCDDWVIFERERLRQLRLHALEAAAYAMCRRERHGYAIDLALEVVRCDRLRESAHRVLIHAYLVEGNVAEARRRYRELERVLHADLGIAPTPAVAALVAPWIRQPQGAWPGAGTA